MKRFSLVIFGGVILFAAILCWFLFFRSPGVYGAVPKSAIVAVECDDWAALTAKLGNTASGKALSTTAAVSRLRQRTELMGRLFGYDDKALQAFNSRHLVASLHLTTAGDFDYLFTVALKGINDNALLNHVQSAPGVKNVQVRLFRNQKVVDVFMRDGAKVTFAKLKDYFVFSTVPFLTEASVSAILGGEGIAGEKGFKTIANHAHTGNATIFFDFSKADIITPLLFDPAKSYLFNSVKKTGGWGSFNITLESNSIELTGTTCVDGKVEAAAGAGITSLWKYIPANAGIIHISKNDSAEYPGEEGALYFNSWLGGSKAFITLEPLQADFLKRNVLIAESAGKAKATAALKGWLVTEGSAPAAVQTFMDYDIYAIAHGEVINRVFGETFTQFRQGYFAIGGQVVIFSNNLDVLKLVIEKAARGDVAAALPTEDAKNTSSVICMYPGKLQMLATGLWPAGSTAKDFFGAFSKITVTNTAANNFIFSQVKMDMAAATAGGPATIWKTQLKAPCLSAPQLVGNSAAEIFVQDTANNIYVLNNSGEIIFTRNTGEPVFGSMYQLDYYNNGNRQYIFNSAARVYIVDQAGNDIAAYPLRLSYPATTGLLLLADSLYGAHKYFVPCANGGIYGFAANGRPLPRWSPKGGLGTITVPLMACGGAGKSYIAAYGTTGRLTLFEAGGNKVWDITSLEPSVAPVCIHGGTFSFLAVSGNQLVQVSAEGNDDTHLLLDQAGALAAFAGADSGYIYCYASGNILRAYNEAHNFIGSNALKVSGLCSLQAIQAAGGNYFAATDCSGGAILLDARLQPAGTIKAADGAHTLVADLFLHGLPVAIQTHADGAVSCTTFR